MNNLSPLHELPANLQDDKNQFCIPQNTFEILRGKTRAFMVYSLLCSNYDFLRKYSFITTKQIQRKLGFGSSTTVSQSLKVLKELGLIEVKKIEGIRGNCYQIYFQE